MPRYLVLYHFAADHSLRHFLTADSISEARAQVIGSLRREGDFHFFERREDESLFLIPTAGLRSLQIIEAERETAEPAWKAWDLNRETG